MARCDRNSFDEAWEILSDAYKNASLKHQDEKTIETTTGKGRDWWGTDVCTRTHMQNADVRFHRRSQCTDLQEEEMDRANQIHERYVEEDRMRQNEKKK